MANKHKNYQRTIKRFVKCFPICLLVLLFLAFDAKGQDPGKKVFETKCFSCHSVGGGDKQGPDLKGLTDRRQKAWIDEFVRTPTAMSKKDAAAADVFKRFAPEIMPDQSITQEELDAVVEMIRSLTAKNEIFTPEGAKLARAIKAGDADGGWKYFTGQKRFQNGGVSCNSCHSAARVGRLGGGTLGPDLTSVGIKYRDPELILILQNPNFPTMTEMFRDHKLTDEEIVQLFAYLQNVKQANPNAPVVATATTGKIDPRFVLSGFSAALLALFGLNFIWRKRHKGVREDIVRRSKI